MSSVDERFYRNFFEDIDRRVEQLDARLDQAVKDFDKSFPQEIQEEIAQIQSDMISRSGDFARNNSGDRYVGGKCCKTDAEYADACAKFYGPI